MADCIRIKGHMNSTILLDPALTQGPSSTKKMKQYEIDFYNKYKVDPCLIPYEEAQEAERNGVVSTKWMSSEFLSKFENPNPDINDILDHIWTNEE